MFTRSIAHIHLAFSYVSSALPLINCSHVPILRSAIVCNRVRTNTLTKWVVKEFCNVLIPETDHGIFYSEEAYIVRWVYVLTMVRELEGITPGHGPFALDKEYRKELQVNC